jgi:hypothetical protein
MRTRQLLLALQADSILLQHTRFFATRLSCSKILGPKRGLNATIRTRPLLLTIQGGSVMLRQIYFFATRISCSKMPGPKRGLLPYPIIIAQQKLRFHNKNTRYSVFIHFDSKLHSLQNSEYTMRQNCMSKTSFISTPKLCIHCTKTKQKMYIYIVTRPPPPDLA